ncbi:MAG: iron chelate uptake ABC transporter family permease subunit [Pseudonocardiaceae bacterium]
MVATGLGVPVRRCHSVLLLIGVVLTAGAVSVVGALSFLGLVAPHLARLATGSDARRLFPLSTLVGSALLLGADVVARVVTTPAVPVGTVVAVIGAPMLAWLLTRRLTSAQL